MKHMNLNSKNMKTALLYIQKIHNIYDRLKLNQLLPEERKPGQFSFFQKVRIIFFV